MNTAERAPAPTHQAHVLETPPIFLVTLQAPSDADAIRLLRAALKVLGRRFALRCLRVEQVRQ
jgi:hypothetical protein